MYAKLLSSCALASVVCLWTPQPSADVRDDLRTDGWVQVKGDDLRSWTDVTLYTGRTIYYLGTDPLKGPAKNVDWTGPGYVYERKIDSDTHCYRSPGTGNMRWQCWSVWKKGDKYVEAHQNGYNKQNLLIKPGNTENLGK